MKEVGDFQFWVFFIYGEILVGSLIAAPESWQERQEKEEEEGQKGEERRQREEKGEEA